MKETAPVYGVVGYIVDGRAVETSWKRSSQLNPDDDSFYGGATARSYDDYDDYV